MTYTVRPTHPLLPILCPGLGWWWSPLGLGRVVEKGSYTGDGPSIGPVTDRTMAWAIMHDLAYRNLMRRATRRITHDALARKFAKEAGSWWGARRWQWCLADPILRLAWRYGWGGWQDLPGWLWWICAAVYGLTAWGAIGAGSTWAVARATGRTFWEVAKAALATLGG